MMTIILPWPDSALSPNSHLHWRHKEPARVLAIQTAFVLAKKVKWPYPPGADIMLHLVLCPPDRRRRDWDNLVASCKFYQDGFCAAWGIDDSQIRGGTWRWGNVVKGGEVCVKLEVM